MATERELRHQAREAIRRMVANERVICGDELLDFIAQDDEFDDYGTVIASAYNRKKVGTKDTYVCWIGEDAKPELMFDAGMNAFAER